MDLHQRKRFVLWSIHKDPFPEATTPLSLVTRYLLACILLAIQLALMVGVPMIPSLIAWFMRTKLWSALIDAGKIVQAREVIVYLALLTVLLAFSIWGTIPLYAIARVHGKRARAFAYVSFGVVLVMFLGVSVRSLYLAMSWALHFDDDARIADQCNLVARVLGALLCSWWISIVLLFFYATRFGTPVFIQQSMDNVTNLLYPDLAMEQNRSGKTDDA